MRSLENIREILDELQNQAAEDLEDQDIDFKEWILQSMKDAISLVVEMAICMANAGGGTVVFGVNDKAVSRGKAILGVPSEINVNRLKKAVYDSTDPKLTPVFEELMVPEGTGRLLVMQIYRGLPPYTDTSGGGKIRVGKDCQPLTGTLRRRIMVETGETDYTAEPVVGPVESLLSPAALEQLREVARREKAPEELLSLNDVDLLKAIGVLDQGRLTLAGLLLAGKPVAIQRHLPAYLWTHLRMRGDTDYTDRMDGRDALVVGLIRLLDRIMADNPITTLEHGLFHFEYRTYPEIALREALMNAFCHTDYRIPGPILVKQFSHKLEISNLGGFIGGISPENILHHTPAARNPNLVDALAKLRLVNRSNLGIPRIYASLLIEGKEPPIIEEQGESVKVTFLARELAIPFRIFVAEENKQGRLLSVDHLLILHHLLRHAEITSAEAARLCQRYEYEARQILSVMEREFEYLDRGGTGKGTYWTLRSELHQRLAAPGHPERDKRIDWEAAKTRVLSVLKHRAERREKGLSNAEIRQLTHYDRNQARRLMLELMQENPQVKQEGEKRWARYAYSL